MFTLHKLVYCGLDEELWIGLILQLVLTKISSKVGRLMVLCFGTVSLYVLAHASILRERCRNTLKLHLKDVSMIQRDVIGYKSFLFISSRSRFSVDQCMCFGLLYV